jgi:hypothetical protein
MIYLSILFGVLAFFAVFFLELKLIEYLYGRGCLFMK